MLKDRRRSVHGYGLALLRPRWESVGKRVVLKDDQRDSLGRRAMAFETFAQDVLAPKADDAQGNVNSRSWGGRGLGSCARALASAAVGRRWPPTGGAA